MRMRKDMEEWISGAGRFRGPQDDDEDGAEGATSSSSSFLDH